MKVGEQHIRHPGLGHQATRNRIEEPRGYRSCSVLIIPIDNKNFLPLLQQLQENARARKPLPDNDVIVCPRWFQLDGFKKQKSNLFLNS